MCVQFKIWSEDEVKFNALAYMQEICVVYAAGGYMVSERYDEDGEVSYIFERSFGLGDVCGDFPDEWI